MSKTSSQVERLAERSKGLVEAIRVLIEVTDNGFTEYELISQLNDQGWRLPTSAADSLALFTSHFLVYRALFQLQKEYWQQQRYLKISALDIRLYPREENESGRNPLSDYSVDEKLREYYWDLDNLYKASEASVNELLRQFWQRLATADELMEALTIMGLKQPIDSKRVKERYRTLAMQYHPDRGGTAAAFQRINWAFGVLQRNLPNQ